MYHPTTTMTLNRHRVVSVDGYWAPGGNCSTLAADISTRGDQYTLPSTTTSYSTNGMDHMSIARPTYHHNHHQDYVVAEASSNITTMMPPPRRSHRPRGCRGGRKNRKVKPSNQDVSQAPSTTNNTSPYRTSNDDARRDNNGKIMFHPNHEPTLPLLPAAPNHSVIVKGDLSPYQHLKVTNKPWNFSVMCHQSVSHTGGGTQSSSLRPQPSPVPQQMLPPPVPSALFESHRQNIEAMNRTMNASYGNSTNTPGSALKMLPSFDSDDLENDHGDDAGDDVHTKHHHHHHRHQRRYCDGSKNSNSNDDEDDESIEFGLMIPKPPHGLDRHRIPSRHDNTYSQNEIRHIIPTIHFRHDNCEDTVDTCYTTSSRSRSSSSSSSSSTDHSVVETANPAEMKSMQSSKNNFDSHIHNVAPPHTNATTVMMNPPHLTSKTFRLPIFHLHITPPPQQQQEHQHPTPSRSSTNSLMNHGNYGFGSLFVTSPRSFLFGMGQHNRSNSTARPIPITQQQ